MMKKMDSFKAIIFDLDGVIVKSVLDFKLIRKEIFGSESDEPVLEQIEQLKDPEKKKRAIRILENHETTAAFTSELNFGILALLKLLSQKKIKCAIVTRNSRKSVSIVLDRFKLDFDTVITRKEAPPKPAKEPVLLACKKMGLQPEEVILIGDYEFDMLAGKRAGVTTILLRTRNQPSSENADMVIDSILELAKLIS
jgi:HAD superfamily hydrolase (TIGR01509 family)